MNENESEQDNTGDRSGIDRRYYDRDRLYQLYYVDGYDQAEIAEFANCAERTVSKWMQDFGIGPGKGAGGPDPLSRPKPSVSPAPFSTGTQGYERWEVSDFGEAYTILVHRLLAVAKYGLEAVAGNSVHHRNGIPFDNRYENITVMSRSKHSSHHANDQPRRGGRFA